LRYNPKTDTLTPSFVKQESADKNIKRKSLASARIRIFIFIFIALVISFFVFKYHAKLGDAIFKAKKSFSRKQDNKAKKVNHPVNNDNENKITGLSDVRAFKAPAEKLQRKDKLVEGIFYDAAKKSYCVINGQLLSEGDNFQNILIKKISKDSVEVLEDGKRKILRVERGSS